MRAMSIEVRATEAGASRYDVRYRDPAGRQRKKSFRTRRDAERYEREQRYELEHSSWMDPTLGRTTFAAVAEMWLADPTKRQATADRDRAVLERHILPVLGECQVARISPEDVQRLVNSWITAGKAPATVVRQHSAVRSVLSHAEGRGMIPKNPALARSPRNPYGIKLPRVDLVERPELSAKDLAKVADELGKPWDTFMWCGAVLGLRWAETAGIVVGAVDLDKGLVDVRQQVDRNRAIVSLKTSGSRRRLGMPVWLNEQFKEVIGARAGAGAGDLVFVDSGGGPIHYSNCRTRTWGPAVRRAGFPALRFHDLRSLAASALIAAGVDVKTAQARLGHSNPQTTLGIYARVMSDRDQAAADAVGELFHPSDP